MASLFQVDQTSLVWSLSHFRWCLHLVRYRRAKHLEHSFAIFHSEIQERGSDTAPDIHAVCLPDSYRVYDSFYAAGSFAFRQD